MVIPITVNDEIFVELYQLKAEIVKTAGTSITWNETFAMLLEYYYKEVGFKIPEVITKYCKGFNTEKIHDVIKCQ